MSDLARTMLGAALLAVAACTPATPATGDGAASTPVVVIPAPAATALASASPEVTVPSPLPSDGVSAGVAPSALPAFSAAVANAVAPRPSAAFRCFSWAHERDFSTDCYRTQTQCLTELRHMKEGARLPTECEPTPHASCTTLVKGGDEHCFGDAPNCGRYRAFVGRNHLETTDCVPR